MERALPELLILDIMLPEEDGLSILRRLRASPRTEHLPVMMLTARAANMTRSSGWTAARMIILQSRSA